jgi:hypothetical protein
MPPSSHNHRRRSHIKKAAAGRILRQNFTQVDSAAANGSLATTSTAASANNRNYITGRTTPSIRLRGRFNPIRQLTPESLARALEAFQAGDLRLAALLWDAMERRDDVLCNVALKRKKAVARLEWEILALDDSPTARRHREALLAFYNNLTVTHACDPHQRGGVGLLVKQMLDAVGKKYAVHEIIWQPLASRTQQPAANGEILTPSQAVVSAQVVSNSTASPQPAAWLTATFRFAPLWFFEARTGPLRFLPDDTATEGVDLASGQWLVTIADGLMEASSIAYLFKQRQSAGRARGRRHVLSRWSRPDQLLG